MKIDKEIGFTPLMLFGPLVVVSALHLLPLLLGGLSLPYILFQTRAGAI